MTRAGGIRGGTPATGSTPASGGTTPGMPPTGSGELVVLTWLTVLAPALAAMGTGVKLARRGV